MHRPHDQDYLPAAGHDRMLPLYDVMRRLWGVPRVMPMLLDAAGIEPGDRVLDLGTGTGEVALMVGRRCPGAEVVGIDPDPRALGRARRKVADAGLDGWIRFERGFGQEPPVPRRILAHVISAFVFHHLDTGAKEGTLAEVGRVLRTGRPVHLLDVGGGTTKADGWVARFSMRAPLLQGNHGDAVPGRMRAVGLVEATAVGHVVTRRLGRVTLWRAVRPSTTGGA